MQEGSLVTNSDVDTQVIYDLMKGRIDSDRSGGRKYLTTVISDCSFVPIHSSIPHKDMETIESFTVESPVSYDDIQDETFTLKHRGSADPTVSDSGLDCSCHVSVC